MNDETELYCIYIQYGFYPAVRNASGGENGTSCIFSGRGRAKIGAGKHNCFSGMADGGKVQGYAKASARYHVAAVCGVGMGATGSQIEDVRKANAIGPELPVFTLQGGFDMTKLKGIYKLMMTVMSKTVGKKLAEKPDRTPEEDDMLELMVHGGSRVREEYLTEVVDWYHKVQ